MNFDRVICIVLDGCGAGAAPDSADFNDFGENEGHTIRNVWNAVQGINAPSLARIGFFDACGIETGTEINAKYGRLQEVSIGKDTVTGHWEMMGIELSRPFPTYPNGFPEELIHQFESKIGTETIGHMPASGTEIIKQLGAQHMDTGYPIVYTSADSVFQIACHESVVPVERLYEHCRVARELLVYPNDVGRVIARPFTGSAETGFQRTQNRKDFPLPPPRNLVDTISARLGPVFGIGVIPEVFNHRGFIAVKRTQTNAEHEQMLDSALESDAKFIWSNFEDFDMLYGHRNDARGFATALETFDQTLAKLEARLIETDLLLLTADHGNDPTTPSTDHSREFVPLCAWSPNLMNPGRFADKVGFWNVGATVAEALGVEPIRGESVLR